MLQDELTADEAVAIAMANNPRLQVTLAELGIARADLIEASTIANPLFEVEMRFPRRAVPRRSSCVSRRRSSICIQLPRRRAIGRAAFDAAKMRVTSEVLRFAADVRASYYELLAASQHVAQSRTHRRGRARQRPSSRMRQHDGAEHHRSRSRERAGAVRAGEARSRARGAAAARSRARR